MLLRNFFFFLTQGDDEFEHLHDEEEFENFDRDKDSLKTKTPDKLPDLQMATVGGKNERNSRFLLFSQFGGE